MESAVENDSDDVAILSKERRSILVLILLVLLCGGGFCVYISSNKIPEFAGGPIDDYLIVLGKRTSQPGYHGALRAVHGAGPEFLRYYVRVGYERRPWYAFRVGMLQQRFPNKVTSTINNWVNPNDLRRGAQRALASFNHDNLVHSVTNDLAELLSDPGTGKSREIASLINSFGGNSAVAVIPWLSEPDPRRVGQACEIISDCGSLGSFAVPALINLYQAHPEYAEEVFSTFKQIGDASRPAFADAMRSENITVRRAALKFVRTDPAMLEYTIPMLVDPDVKLRSYAALTIVGWRLSAARRSEDGARADALDQGFAAVVFLEQGREELLVVIEEILSSLREFERVRASTAYCLYAGTENSMMQFLENRANSEHRSKRVEAEEALHLIRKTVNAM